MNADPDTVWQIIGALCALVAIMLFQLNRYREEQSTLTLKLTHASGLRIFVKLDRRNSPEQNAAEVWAQVRAAESRSNHPDGGTTPMATA